MNWTAIEAVAEALGAVAVVVSLLYLATQVRHSVKQARFDAERDLTQNFVTLSLAITQDRMVADIFVRGCAGDSGLDAAQQAQFRTYMNATFKLVEQQFRLSRQAVADEEIWSGLEAMVLDLSRLPGVRTWWAGRSAWFTASFQEYVAKMMEAAPELPPTTDLVPKIQEAAAAMRSAARAT